MQTTAEKGLSMSEIAASYVKSNFMLDSFVRLEIYNRQYWFRVIDAVSDDFPAFKAVLGKKRFDTLVLAYLQENTVRTKTVRVHDIRDTTTS